VQRRPRRWRLADAGKALLVWLLESAGITALHPMEHVRHPGRAAMQRRVILHAIWLVTPSANPPYNSNSFSALPWAMRSLSAALTGNCSKKARPSAMD
jgi:hypothetical protein